MEDLGYPKDSRKLIGNIYTNSTTMYIREYLKKTEPIHIQRGTIQGDTLSPYLFILFLELLLKWLQRRQNKYIFRTSNSRESAAAYVNDLAAIINNIKALQIQLNKIQRFNTWAGMDLSILECAITGTPYKSKMTPEAFKAYIQTHKITYNNKILPTLHQNEPFKYLGIQLISSLKWNLQRQISTDKLINQSKQLLASPTTIKQKIKIVNTVLRPGVEYSFHAIPYSMPDIKKLDKLIITLMKAICKVP
jgi:hypothetical protein